MADFNPKSSSAKKKPAKARLQFADPFDTDDAILEMIQTEEADLSLWQFPTTLRQQLEDHLRYDSDNIVEFTGSANANFHLNLFSDGEPAKFVVPGTTEALDSAVYRYGQRKRSKNIIVVQSKPGSQIQFNGGKPAIISYFGKGKKGSSVSRYAIWGPDGFRLDMYVDRIRDPSAIRVTPVIKKTKAQKADARETSHESSAARLQQLYPSDESDVAEDDNNEVMNLSGFDDASSRSYRDWTTSTEQNSQTHDGNQLRRGPNLPLPSDVRNSIFASLSHHPTRYTTPTDSLKRTRRPPATMNDDYEGEDEDDNERYPVKFQRLESIDPTPPVSINEDSHPYPSSVLNGVVLTFKQSTTDHEHHFSRALQYCNDVQKLFAYARIAQISNPTHAMLSATFADGDTVEIIRDDAETFGAFLETVQQKREDENIITEVVITPAEY